MTFYIMADDTSIDAWDAIQESWKMMKGYKRTYLWLNIVLIFVMIPISIFTLFLGLLWFIPFLCVVAFLMFGEIGIGGGNGGFGIMRCNMLAII